MQQARLFRIYNQYRLVISLILCGLLLVDADLIETKYRDMAAYQVTALSYAGLNLFTGMLALTGFQAQKRHINLSILIDIIILHLLLMFSSGITSGLANLIIVSVAAANILIPSRTGILFAAMATIFSLGLALWGSHHALEQNDAILRAGFLGTVYFAAAFFLQNIALRLSASEALAQERARSIAELEQLNHQIIQRMRTGILVSTLNGDIRMLNASAQELLWDRSDAVPRHLPQPLMLRLEQWLLTHDNRAEPFRATAILPQVKTSFSRLDRSGSDALILIFLEDTSKVAQQAQQMKLASLGRLSAAIAHEIRNPLGAISHAAQLLSESQDLTMGDGKMCEIIQRHSRRVNGIVENVLQLSRRSATHVERLNLNQWLAEFIQEYQHLARSPCTMDIKLHPGKLSTLFDPSQLEQVMINLADNGLRYSEHHTGQRHLLLRTGMAEDQERAYIEVQDDGPGIPLESRESVFEPFYTTHQGGTGLGLYLARELCEANQAQLTIVSALDSEQGACFRILFAHQRRQI